MKIKTCANVSGKPLINQVLPLRNKVKGFDTAISRYEERVDKTLRFVGSVDICYIYFALLLIDILYGFIHCL